MATATKNTINISLKMLSLDFLKFEKLEIPKYKINPEIAVPLPANSIIIADLILISLSLKIPKIMTNKLPT